MKSVSSKIMSAIVHSRLSIKIQAFDRVDIYLGINAPVLRSVASTITQYR
jgi:hypothetical protein